MRNHQTIFLTGGTGLVGQSISKMLQDNSITTTAIYRSRKFKLKNIEWVKFDILNDPIKELSKYLKNTDIIIHTAACLKLGNTTEEIDEIQKTNINFTRDLLDNAVYFKIKKIIFISSLSLIKKPLPLNITENSDLETTSFYSESKLVCEEMIKEYEAKYGLKYTFLRISSPISPKLDLIHDTVFKKWINCSLNHEKIKIFGKGGRTQDFIETSDISNAILKSIHTIDTNEIFNIASGEPISMLRLAQLFKEEFNTEYEFDFEDQNEADRWNVSIEKAKNQLDFTPFFSSENAVRSVLKKMKK